MYEMRSNIYRRDWSSALRWTPGTSSHLRNPCAPANENNSLVKHMTVCDDGQMNINLFVEGINTSIQDRSLAKAHAPRKCRLPKNRKDGSRLTDSLLTWFVHHKWPLKCIYASISKKCLLHGFVLFIVNLLSYVIPGAGNLYRNVGCLSILPWNTTDKIKVTCHKDVLVRMRGSSIIDETLVIILLILRGTFSMVSQ